MTRAGALLLLIVLVFATPAAATQHLLRAGAEPARLIGKLRPGDELILLPGVHRPLDLTGIRGTAEAPITVRSADPRNASEIKASGYGINATETAHLVIRNVRILPARLHALTITGASADEPAEGFSIEKVTIVGAGLKGDRHSINLEHVQRVRIEDCRITEWSGSAIELRSCRKVTVRNCTIETGSPHAVSGIRARGGSADIVLEGCRIIDPGVQGICLGGNPRRADLPYAGAENLEPHVELWTAIVDRCVIRGGLCNIALLHARDVRIAACTLANASDAVFSIRRGVEEATAIDVENCLITDCLVTWGEIEQVFHLAGGATFDGVELGANLWWSPTWNGPTDTMPLPGRALLPQTFDLDPALNGDLRPTNTNAVMYGHVVE